MEQLAPPRRLAYPVAAAAFAFALVTASLSADATLRASEPRRNELADLVMQRRAQVDALEAETVGLRRAVEAEVDSVNRLGRAGEATAEAARILALQAGAVALRGPGLEVVMGDSDREPGPGEDPTLYRVHDIDIQHVVNALFHLGAEAVAVDDQRVVSVTAIRAAGETILVNYRPLVPPYRIRAIGVGQKPFLDEPVARRMARWEGLFGLGFRVRPSSEVEVPAFTRTGSVRHAEPGRPLPPAPPGRT